MFLMLALGLGFTACSDDDDDDVVYDNAPEVAAAGTYTGTWTRDEDGVISTAEGSLTFATTWTVDGETKSSPYVTYVTADCPELDIHNESTANITYAGTGFQFSNMADTNNGFGANFYGEISSKGVATISYTLVVMSGRTRHVYTYTFSGTK